MRVRQAVLRDLEDVASLRLRLWPEGSLEEHRCEATAILAGEPPSTLPLTIFVVEENDAVIGLIEVGLRSHADGCDPARPCGFVEGWYVVSAYRRHGAGRLLMETAEQWAQEQGCAELASDTWIDNEESQQAHIAFGFEVVDRCVHFKRPLAPAAADDKSPSPLYGADLARVHHEHFGAVARAAAQELLTRLAGQGISSGTIVDLAAGTGILDRAVSEAGFDAWGVDISGDMLRIARKTADEAKLTLGSLWDAALPPCVAVAAIGEAFSYNADGKSSSSALRARIETIHDALAPGGVLLFDVACPGRSGADGLRRVFWTKDNFHLGLEEREDRDARRLLRDITVFVPEANLYRRSHETHVLYLYAPHEVEAALTASGFAWERLSRYADFELSAGWQAYAAWKKTR